MKNTLKVLIAVVLTVTMVWFVSACAPEDNIGWTGAGGSPYTGATKNPQPMDINASKSTGDSRLGYDRCLVLDPQGNPHIAWEDGTPGNPDIYYVRWGGTDWLCADESVYDPTIAPAVNPANVSDNDGVGGDSYHPSLTIDDGGNPHIAWQDDTLGNSGIYYVCWNDSDWLCADGSVYDPTIAPAVNPANVSDNDGHSYTPLLAIDGGGNLHIVWYDNTPGNYDIYYVRWDGTNWLCADGGVYNPTTNPNPANVSDNGGDSYYPSLVVDGGGNPHIAWEDDTPGNFDTYYIRWDGTNWLCADGSVYDPTIVPPAVNPANVSDNGSSYIPSLAIDGGGNPHIAWYDTTPGIPIPDNFYLGNPDIYYVCWDGKDWLCADGSVYDPTTDPNPANVSDNGGDSRSPSLAIDDGGNPHIAWHDKFVGNYDIYYVRWLNNFDECEEETPPEEEPEPEPIPEPEPVIQITKLKFQIDRKSYLLDGNERAIDVAPIIQNGRTLLPARFVTEPLGGDVSWDGTEKKVVCALGETTVELWIGKSTAKVNGVEVRIDPNNPEVVPTIINDRTMVPMRFLAESLGCEVEWLADTKEIILTHKGI